MAVQYANGRIVTDGLVLCLNAADKNSYPGSGTTWTDVSGNGNNGTLTNGPTFTTSYGGGIIFDGVDDYVPFSNPSSMSNNNISIQIWFLPTSGGGLLIRNRTYGWQIYTGGSNGDISCNLYPTSNVAQAISINTSAGYVTANRPANVAITFGGSTLRLYINGTLFNSANAVSDTIYYGGPAISLGRDGDSASSYLSGTIYNTQIYNRALSSSEILQNYNAQKTRFGL